MLLKPPLKRRESKMQPSKKLESSRKPPKLKKQELRLHWLILHHCLLKNSKHSKPSTLKSKSTPDSKTWKMAMPNKLPKKPNSSKTTEIRDMKHFKKPHKRWKRKSTTIKLKLILPHNKLIKCTRRWTHYQSKCNLQMVKLLISLLLK